MSNKKFDPYFFENKILLAMPGLIDPEYTQTVIFIVSYHVGEGAKGFIVNRPSKHATLEDLFLELNLPLPEQFHKIPAYDGGPFSPNSGYILHMHDRNIADSVDINDKISLSLTQDVLQRISKNKAPKNFQVFYGRCVWEMGQLEVEIKHNLWAVCDFNERFLFQQDPPEEQWKKAFASIGIDTRLLSPKMPEV